VWLNIDLGWCDLIQFQDTWFNFHVGVPLGIPWPGATLGLEPQEPFLFCPLVIPTTKSEHPVTKLIGSESQTQCEVKKKKYPTTL